MQEPLQPCSTQNVLKIATVHNEGSLTHATLRCRPDCSALQRRCTCGHQGRIFHISNTLDSQTFANNCFRKTSKKTHTRTFLCLQLYSFVNRKQEVPPAARVAKGRGPTTLAKKIETAARTWHRRVICRACTRLCLACVPVSIFLATVVFCLPVFFSKACGRLALSDQFPRGVVHRHFLALSSFRLTGKFKKSHLTYWSSQFYFGFVSIIHKLVCSHQ